MRQLIRNYSITGEHQITVQEQFTIEDVRLIVNETIPAVLVSSMQKNNIVSVVNGVITLLETTPELLSSDILTIEIDIDNIAKKEDLETLATEDNATHNKEEIMGGAAGQLIEVYDKPFMPSCLTMEGGLCALFTIDEEHSIEPGSVVDFAVWGGAELSWFSGDIPHIGDSFILKLREGQTYNDIEWHFVNQGDEPTIGNSPEPPVVCIATESRELHAKASGFVGITGGTFEKLAANKVYTVSDIVPLYVHDSDETVLFTLQIPVFSSSAEPIPQGGKSIRDVWDKIDTIPQPVIPTDYAKEQTLTSKSSEIITEVHKGGGNPSKMAYEAMKRLQPYLYSIEYSELDYEAAREYFATHFVPVDGACTALRKGNQLGRNYDWTYDKQVEFLVRTKAHNGRYASIGIAGSISALTTDTIGEYSDEYKWLPFRMLDGMNEKGLTANVNMLNHDEERSLPQAGTTPLIEEREAICSAMLVRYILDNFATPQEACEYIRDYVRVYPPYSEGHTTDLHFALTNKEQLYYLCFEPDNGGVFRTMIADVKDQPLPFVMTNFRMWWAEAIYDEENGKYDRTQDPTYRYVEKYAMGIERANLCLDFVQDTHTEQSVLEFMKDGVAYTWAYELRGSDTWLTEFVGEYSEEDLARDSAATDFDRILGIVRQRYAERSRETGLTWQTVHSVVYDLDNLTMQLVTQEGSTDDALTIDCFKSLPATKEDIENIDLSIVAKQGSNQNASNTEILDQILALTSSYVISPVTQAEIDAIVQRIINQN